MFLIVSAYALRSSHKSVRLQVGLRADPRRRRRQPARPRALRLRRRLPRLLRLRPPLAGLQRRRLGHLHRRRPALPRHAPQRGRDRVRAPTRRPGVSPSSPASIHIGSFYLPTYGVILAIAYLTGDLAAAPQGAGRRACPTRRSSTSRSTSSRRRSSARRLLLIVVEWRRYVANPTDLVEVLRSGGVFYGGLIAATVVGDLVHAQAPTCPPGRSPTWALPRSRSARRSAAGAASPPAAATARRRHGPFGVTFTDPFAARRRRHAAGRAAPPDADLPVAQRLPDLPDPPVGLPAQDLRRRGVLALRAALRDHARDPRDLARRPRPRLRDPGRPLDVAVHRDPARGARAGQCSSTSGAEAARRPRSARAPALPGRGPILRHPARSLPRRRLLGPLALAHPEAHRGGRRRASAATPAKRSHVVRAGEEVSVEVPEPRARACSRPRTFRSRSSTRTST